MNLQLIRKTVGGAALLCASLVFASQALAAVPLARVIVAKAGGNYLTISAAMAAISPTATAPYLIEVWPGVYTEPGTVIMKSYVHLKGSGRDVTTVKTALGQSANVILADGKTGVTISGLTVTGGLNGIATSSTDTAVGSVTISDNLISDNYRNGIVSAGFSGLNPKLNSVYITGNRVVGNARDTTDTTNPWGSGIEVSRTYAVITGNTISGNGVTRCGVGSCMALLVSNSGEGTILGNQPTHIITGNVIAGNIGSGIYMCKDTRATIANNTIVGNTMSGVEFAYQNAGASVTHNVITNNGGTLYANVWASPTSPAIVVRNPNISFNVFDTISGSHGIGSYNVNSNGDPILVP